LFTGNLTGGVPHSFTTRSSKSDLQNFILTGSVSNPREKEESGDSKDKNDWSNKQKTKNSCKV
jgi:hypothetical protein